MGPGDEEDTGSNRERFRDAAQEEAPDLATLCLRVAIEAAVSRPPAGQQAGGTAQDTSADGHEAVLERAQIELDRLAGLLPYERHRTPAQWARALEQLLGDRIGFRGDPADYRRLESSLLPSVLLRRRGLPILLSVVWIEVARRAGAPVYGVALPGHFVVGFGDPAGDHVLADPFGGGRLLSGSETELLVAGTTGTRRGVPQTMLQPAGPLDIVLRILNNIRAWAAARPEKSDVQLWAFDLSLLLPHRPARLRYERAELLVERADFVGGAQEMEEYAEVIAEVEPGTAEAVRNAARTARSRLN